MKEYHKIETLYQRDIEGTKQLIEGKYRNSNVWRPNRQSTDASRTIR